MIYILRTVAAEATFDRSGHISTVIKDRSKGEYLKLEIYA